MPRRKRLSDAVRALKRLDYTKMILDPGVARVAPVDYTGRVLGAKFLERVLKGQYANFSVEG